LIGTGLLVSLFSILYLTNPNLGITELPQTGDPTDNLPALQQEKIVELNLEVNINIPTVEIKSHNIKDGFVTKQDPSVTKMSYDYRVNQFDENDKLIWEGLYVLPIISNPPPLEDSTFQAPQEFLNIVEITTNIPFFNNAKYVKIISNMENILNEIELPEVALPVGEDVLGISAAPDDLLLNVVIVGDGFTDAQLPQFITVATNLKNYIMSQGPFKQRAPQMDFKILSNTQSLGCSANASTRLILCDWTAAKNVVTAAGLVDDKIIIVYNTSTYSGAGMVNGEFATVYNGSLTNVVAFHEFSHTLNLYDEYDYGSTGQVVSLTYRNCYRNTPPYSGWNDIVPDGEYYPVCAYTNWFRTSANSLMRSNSYLYYNSVSLGIINTSVNNYAGVLTSPDPLPVAQILTPSNNSTTSGSITITSNFTNTNNLHRAELRVNNVLKSVAYTAPYNFVYNLGTTPAKNIAVEVKPVDSLNRDGQASTIILNPDVTPTPTPTNTPVPTSTNTPTPTPTPTRTPVPTSTNTPIPTPTFTPTKTPVPTQTYTSTPTKTPTVTPTRTNTPTPVPTNTNTPIPTFTATPVPTFTNTPRLTATGTLTPTVKPTPIKYYTVCGSLDVDNNGILNYTDFKAFLLVYGKWCLDAPPPTTGCLGKDVRINDIHDNVVNFKDLDYFMRRYQPNPNIPSSCNP
jgi:hypothetical protein